MRQNNCIGKCLPGIFKNARIAAGLPDVVIQPGPLKKQTIDSLGTWFQTNTDTPVSGEFYL